MEIRKKPFFAIRKHCRNRCRPTFGARRYRPDGDPKGSIVQSGPMREQLIMEKESDHGTNM